MTVRASSVHGMSSKKNETVRHSLEELLSLTIPGARSITAGKKSLRAERNARLP